MEKFWTKKKIFFVAFFGVIFFSVSIFSREISLCPSYSYSDCAEFFDNFAKILFPFLFLFFFSLVTYFMKEEVFQAWFRLVRIYIPGSIFLILLAPSYSSNWMFPYDKGMAAVIASVGFIIVSIINITWSYRRTKQK